MSCILLQTPSLFALGNQNNSLSLNQMILLGSHDAASFEIDSMAEPCLGEVKTKNATPLVENPAVRLIATAFSRAQTANLYDQLSVGSRYLDLRVCYQNNQYYASHGFISADYAELTGEINQFVAENPEAIVILDFDNHLFSDDNGYMSSAELTAFAEYLFAHLNNNFIPASDSNDLSLDNLHASGKNLILFTSNQTLLDTYPNIFWNRQNFMISQWYNQPTVKKLLPYLSTDISSGTPAQVSGEIRVLQAQTTPPSNAAIATYVAYPLYARAYYNNMVVYNNLVNHVWDNSKINIVMLNDVVNNYARQVYAWSVQQNSQS